MYVTFIFVILFIFGLDFETEQRKQFLSPLISQEHNWNKKSKNHDYPIGRTILKSLLHCYLQKIIASLVANCNDHAPLFLFFVVEIPSLFFITIIIKNKFCISCPCACSHNFQISMIDISGDVSFFYKNQALKQKIILCKDKISHSSVRDKFFSISY